MGRRFRHFVLVLAIGVVLLAPQLIRADDGLTLESLAEKIETLFQGQSGLQSRVAAIETQLAPTPTKTLRPTATPNATATVVAQAKITATAQADARRQAVQANATATARARYRATQVAQANARSTRQAKPAGCSYSDATIPEPPYSNLDCETWKATFILAEIEFGRISRSQLRDVADLVYPMVATGARYCGISASRLADYVAVTVRELKKQGKPSAAPDNAVTYTLMYVASTDFRDTVEIAGCEQTLATFVILSE